MATGQRDTILIIQVEVWNADNGGIAGTDNASEFLHCKNSPPDVILVGKTVTYWVWIANPFVSPTRREIIRWCKAHHDGTLKPINLDLSKI